MRCDIEPAGTNVVKNRLLQIRIDLRPDPGSPLHALQYVDHFDRVPTEEEIADKVKLAAVPTHKSLNPCLSHFISVPEVFRKEDLESYIRKYYDPSTVATLYNVLTLPKSSHYLSPLVNVKPEFSKEKIKTHDFADLVNSTNVKLSGFNLQLEKGEAHDIISGSIDIGPGAINDAENIPGGNTFICVGNPADGNGSINVWQLYAFSDITGMKVATCFIVAGTNFSTRDWENIGNVASGAVQTFIGLNTVVALNDYAGLFWVNGQMEANSTAGAGMWFLAGDNIPCVNQLFGGPIGLRRYSIYGTGNQPGTPGGSNASRMIGMGLL